MKIRRPKIKNPALIFTTASVVMTFGAAGLGVWVGMRTERARIAHKDENLTKMDFAKILWKEYVSLSLVALAGAGCAIASHRISARDIAKLATLATGSGAAFSKYRSKIREILGEDKEKEIFDNRDKLLCRSTCSVIAVLQLVCLNIKAIKRFDILIYLFGRNIGFCSCGNRFFDCVRKNRELFVKCLASLLAVCLVFEEHRLGDLTADAHNGVKG